MALSRPHEADADHLDDDSNVVTIPSPDGPDRSTTGRTTWTLLLYLTSSAEGCHGGETAFYPHDRKTPKEALVVAPETGMLLLHKHGDDCLLVRSSCPCLPEPFFFSWATKATTH